MEVKLFSLSKKCFADDLSWCQLTGNGRGLRRMEPTLLSPACPTKAETCLGGCWAILCSPSWGWIPNGLGTRREAVGQGSRGEHGHKFPVCSYRVALPSDMRWGHTLWDNTHSKLHGPCIHLRARTGTYMQGRFLTLAATNIAKDSSWRPKIENTRLWIKTVFRHMQQ